MPQQKIDASEAIIRQAMGQCSFWMSVEEIAFSSYLDQGFRQSWPIESDRFIGFIYRLSRSMGLPVLSEFKLKGILSTFKSQAQLQPRRTTAVRYKKHGLSHFINLGDDRWGCIELSASGWQVQQAIPHGVPFVRAAYVKAFPMPQVGGSVDLLKQYVNFKDEGAFRFLVAFILSAMRDSFEYPILVLNGPQGSAKTTTANLVGRFIDPSQDSTTQLPTNTRDLGVIARNRHLLSFDNLSGLKADMSDTLCQVATGLTVNERAYYSNGDLFSFRVHRPVVLNGIAQIVARDDLGRRAFTVDLEQVTPGAKKPLDEYWKAFEKDYPLILGALLDAQVCALKRYDTVKTPETEGLVNVAKWIEAAAPALGWAEGEFTALYNSNRQVTAEGVLDGDEFARVLFDMLTAETKFIGDFEKFTQVTAMHRRPGPKEWWPANSKQWLDKLRRLLIPLQARGLYVKGLERASDGKEWRDPATRRRIVEIGSVQ